MTRADWEKLRARLALATRSAQERAAASPQDIQNVLRARARALAQEPPAGAQGPDDLEVIEFMMAGERYAVESRHVHEVQPLEQLTPLPGTPPFVLGIVNLRGRILSVVDIGKFFDLPRQGLTDLNKVIVIGNGAMTFGMLADRVAGVRRVAQRDLQASLPTLDGIRGQYLKGVTGERLAVLAADRLLSDPGIVVREQVQT